MFNTNLFFCHVCRHKAKAEEEAAADPAVVAELQREVEDLKLRLHMAAEHYKEKYKECQRLQKQVLRFSDQQGVSPNRHQLTYCVPVKEQNLDFCDSVSSCHIPLRLKILWPLFSLCC